MSLLFAQNKTSVATLILASGGNAVTGLVASEIICYVAKNGVAPPTEYDVTGRITELSSSTMQGLYSLELDGSTVLDTEGEVIISVFEDPGIDPAKSFDSYLLRGRVFTKDFSDLDTLSTATNTTVSDIETTVNNSIVPSLSELDTKADQIILDVDTRADTIDSSIATLESTVNTNTATVSELEDSFDGYLSDFDQRVPVGEVVATRSLFVNGTGNVTPPVDKGIWDALGDGETSISGLGLDVKKMLGLSQENYKITDHVYDANNNLISAEVKIYPTADDLSNEVNEIATYEMTASYDGQNRLSSYEVILNED